MANERVIQYQWENLRISLSDSRFLLANPMGLFIVAGPLGV